MLTSRTLDSTVSGRKVTNLQMSINCRATTVAPSAPSRSSSSPRSSLLCNRQMMLQ
uniref:Cl1856_1 n=1 Tax=Arundo donax TaxID=35708 RepID=A0A0A9G3L6_ARUDO